MLNKILLSVLVLSLISFNAHADGPVFTAKEAREGTVTAKIPRSADGKYNITSEAKDGSKSVLNLPQKADGTIDRDAMMKSMFDDSGSLEEGQASGVYNVGVVTKAPEKGNKDSTEYYNNVTDVKTFKNGVMSESSAGAQVFSGKVEFKTSKGVKKSLSGMVTLVKAK